jgi:DNA polymerase III epsilon subunit-like protein
MHLIFVDTETNDHPSKRLELRIVSITWLVAQSNGLTEKLENYIIKPDGFRIASGAMMIHGITEHQARKEGHAITKVLRKFVSDLQSPGEKTIIGHNISFDLDVINTELKRHQFSFDITSLPSICTMRSSVPVCQLPKTRGKGYKNPKLQELHVSLFDQPFSNAHTSKADVEATARCFFELWRKGLFQHLGPASASADLGIKAVIPCPQCNQKLWVPAGKFLDIKCPTCQYFFRKFTG